MLRNAASLTCFALAFGCGAGTSSTTPPTTAERDPATVAASTKLEGHGCRVELVGSWRKGDAAASKTDGAWGAERLDADEGLGVLATPWKAPTLDTEWREDLGSVLNLRREAESSENAGSSISEAEYWGDATDPAAYYTTISSDGTGSLTFVKASPTLLCLFVLAGPFTRRQELLERASALLPLTHAGP